MSNIIHYKGYAGTVEYSAEDKLCFGEIAFINDTVLFEGETEGKTGSQRRSLRRHYDQRKKAWVRKNLTHYFYGLAVMPADRVGRYARTPKVCSCFMCGNPRRYQGGPTLRKRGRTKSTH